MNIINFLIIILLLKNSHEQFISRKFYPLQDQAIINALDESIYGEYDHLCIYLIVL